MLFISYAHVDIGKARRLVDVLEAGGYSVWFDHQLLPGQDWKAELHNAIKSCNAFVYALTEASLGSDWCTWEFANAVKLRRPIVPILLQDGIQIPGTLEQFQYADFSKGTTPLVIARLMKGLQNAKWIPIDHIPIAPSNLKGLPSRAWIEQVDHWTDQFVRPQHSQQNEVERVVAKFAANLWRGSEAVGGRIVMTDQRLLFESHKINTMRAPASIPYRQISNVARTRTLGIVPNGLIILTIDGTEYRFVVDNRNRIIELIREYSVWK